jgi:hypothetical protein
MIGIEKYLNVTNSRTRFLIVLLVVVQRLVEGIDPSAALTLGMT